jgi:hypothetical protein
MTQALHAHLNNKRKKETHIYLEEHTHKKNKKIKNKNVKETGRINFNNVYYTT